MPGLPGVDRSEMDSALLQALAAEKADLDPGLVQSAAMFERVMYRKLIL